jgi:hypothetical protein
VLFVDCAAWAGDVGFVMGKAFWGIESYCFFWVQFTSPVNSPSN